MTAGTAGASLLDLLPDEVAEIAFTEWTEAGRLRHPRFLGPRRDREPKDVVRERPSR